jgi:hypothetical protein
MDKQLIVAFTAEGSTDEVFLGRIITRVLQNISRKHGNAFVVLSFLWLGTAKGNATIRKAIDAHEQTGAQLLVIHRDTDQHSRKFVLNNHLKPIVDQLSAELLRDMPIVPLVIKHEQETWAFADMALLNDYLQKDFSKKDTGLPPNIEDRADAKELLLQLLQKANVQKSGKRKFTVAKTMEHIADNIRLSELKKLPSYQQFTTDLETALHQIGYIR